MFLTEHTLLDSRNLSSNSQLFLFVIVIRKDTVSRGGPCTLGICRTVGGSEYPGGVMWHVGSLLPLVPTALLSNSAQCNLFSSQIDISQALNGTASKNQHGNRGPSYCVNIELRFFDVMDISMQKFLCLCYVYLIKFCFKSVHLLRT